MNLLLGGWYPPDYLALTINICEDVFVADLIKYRVHFTGTSLIKFKKVVSEK